MKTFFISLLLAANALAQAVTNQTAAKLTDSGDNPPFMPVPAGAIAPPESRIPPLSVAVPNEQAPRMMTLVNPGIAIPYNSTIRQVEAFWNGTPLNLIDPSGTQLVEEAHSFGSMIPFFKPLFSLAGLPAGNGTLEIRGLDANGAQVASVQIPSLTIVTPPQPVATSTIALMPHPRIYLTAARMNAIRARPASDIARQRYEAALNRFLDTLSRIPDVTSPAFENEIYDPEDSIPLLGLAYQLNHNTTAASAAHTLAMRIANDYDTGKRDFGRDTGYDIRFGLRDLMLAYDWIYDQFTPAERALIVKVATNWIDWYHANGYAESWPVENYYAGYIQGIALTGIATAGDNAAADRILTLMRTKLTSEMPVMNQRLAGGDWAEGWNYGPYSVTELALVNLLLRDAGEDWSVDFDWMQELPLSMWLQVAPDFSMTQSFGGYSGNYANKTSPAALTVLSATTGALGFFMHSIYTQMNANPNNDFADLPADTFYEMIFDTAGAPPPIAFFQSHFNSGSGRWFSRSGDYFVSAENTSYSYDHYGYANGDVRLYHGTTCLVCPSAYRGPDFDGEAVTPAFSTYLVNGNSQDIILGRNNVNFLNVDRGTYAAFGMRFESSYAINRYDEGIVSPDNPLDYLVREVVHLRPGTLIVRDLHRRRHATDTLVARWHLGSPAVKMSTFYPPGVTMTNANDVDGGNNVIGTLVSVAFPSSTDAMEAVTVFSETLTATAYANGVLTLSDGTRVVFANNSSGKRRAVRP